jgi:hypothetical protein
MPLVPPELLQHLVPLPLQAKEHGRGEGGFLLLRRRTAAGPAQQRSRAAPERRVLRNCTGKHARHKLLILILPNSWLSVLAP